MKVAFSARQNLEGKGKVFVPCSPSFFSTRGQGSPSAVLSPAQNLTAIPAHLPPARGLGALLQHHWCPLPSLALWSEAAHGVPWKENGRGNREIPILLPALCLPLGEKKFGLENGHTVSFRQHSIILKIKCSLTEMKPCLYPFAVRVEKKEGQIQSMSECFGMKIHSSGIRAV